jgi:processive 1,2-diacylglycerol beta-glucosyltransferase
MRRILIISASSGSGHTIAARAIEQSLEKLRTLDSDFEVTHIDLLQFSTALYKIVYRDVYLLLAKKQPMLYGYIFATSDRLHREKKPDFMRRFMDTINAIKFTSFLRGTGWDVIVSTHFLSSQIIGDLKRRKRLDVPLLTVTTDFGLHAYWIVPQCEHYVVANEASRAHLAASGIPPERVNVLGIPVLPAFAEHKPRAALLRKHGLRPDLPVVLLLSGGFGVGPIERVIGDLVRVAAPFQLVAVAGKNKKLHRDMQGMAGALPYPLLPVGFTEAMDEFMRMADIVISKPGGLTTAESLACGLPMLVLNPIPGQEDMNSDMLLEHGAGIKAAHLVDVPYQLESVLANPRRLAAMRRAALGMARPRAAEQTAALILDIARRQEY